MKKTKKQAQKAQNRAGSMRAAAGALGCHVSLVARAKADGCDAFTSNGGVLLESLRRWIEDNRERLESEPESLKDQKLREQVIRLRRENDLEESRLVRSDWLRERFHRIMGEVGDIRAKSLDTHPHLFRAPGEDVAACRTTVKAIWDSVMADIQKCHHHLLDPPKA